MTRSKGFSYEYRSPQAAGGLSAGVTAAGEPTNAREAAERKTEIDHTINERYADWKATRNASEQRWLDVLEGNLGPYYLPIFKTDKVNGIATSWDYVEDNPGLPRVLLLGDSISRGYTLGVRNALVGKANILRAPANCGSTVVALEKLELWLDGGDWDLIHFNFGIHDRSTADPVYLANLQTIIDRLRLTGATLIWGRTTPSMDGQNAEGYTPERCCELNALADELMRKNNIVINDLYSLVADRLEELQLPKNVHFSDAGNVVLGRWVSECIESVLALERG